MRNDPMIKKRDRMIIDLIINDKMAMVNVAKIFGISQQRVQQIYREWKKSV